LISSLFDEQITQEILAIPINRHITSDELMWTGTKNGAYTVKNGYNLLRDRSTTSKAIEHPSSSYQTPLELWNAIWHMRTSPKVKIFIWNAYQNAIPTKENLLK